MERVRIFFNGFVISTFFAVAAVAQDEAAAESPSMIETMLPILLMLGVFFFLIILPQSRKAKKQTEFVNSLEKGDAVMTSSGIYGKIYGLADRVITLEIAPNVRIRVDRSAIASKDAGTGTTAAAANS